MCVSIIIINYNTFELTCACINSIIKYTRVAHEIIVVDNASDKDDPDKFKLLFPSIILVKNPDNNGFAKGNNLGIEHATGDIFLLLNSDTYLIEDSISIVANVLMKDKTIGALTVKLVYEDRVYQKNARRFPGIKRELMDLGRPLLMLLNYHTRAKLMLNQYFKGDFNTDCDWVSGAFMMFRRDVLMKLPDNKLDDRFFMYGEDELWCYQIKEAGYRNYFFAETTVVHIANASTAPAKQMALLKTMTDRELQIMRYRKGRSLYYYVFSGIYLTKQKLLFNIKMLIFKLFKKRLR